MSPGFLIQSQLKSLIQRYYSRITSRNTADRSDLSVLWILSSKPGGNLQRFNYFHRNSGKTKILICNFFWKKVREIALFCFQTGVSTPRMIWQCKSIPAEQANYFFYLQHTEMVSILEIKRGMSWKSDWLNLRILNPQKTNQSSHCSKKYSDKKLDIFNRLSLDSGK